MATIKVIMCHRPHGQRRYVDISNVYSEDADFINRNNILVSIEEIPIFHMAVYFDYGKRENGEPKEWTEFSKGRSCQDTIKTGLDMVRKLMVQSEESMGNEG